VKRLDVEGGSRDDRAHVHKLTCNGARSQEWRVGSFLAILTGWRRYGDRNQSRSLALVAQIRASWSTGS
jgi:hypothetical protein